jgi:hypothetical protein
MIISARITRLLAVPAVPLRRLDLPLLLLALLVTALSLPMPANAVWGGELDGNRHPMVGAIYADITPAVHRHGRSYSILVKDNYYSGEGPFTLTRLDAGLKVRWRFANPNGVEWCINAPAVDRRGAVFGVNEDGNL